MNHLRLYSYQQHLEQKGYAKNTIDQYMACMSLLKRNGITEDSSSAEIQYVIYSLGKSESSRRVYVAAITEYENEIMKKKEGMLKGSIRYQCLQENKAAGKGIEPVRSERSYRSIIGNAKDAKIKVPLHLQIESGLRISEISNLLKKDITMRNGNIWLYVAPGKTKASRYVKVLKSPKLYRELEDYLKKYDDDSRVFIPDELLKSYLAKKGGKTHDLRRYNARRRYIEHRKAGKGKKESAQLVAKQLGHEKVDNTRRYLGEVYRNDKGGKWHDEVSG